MDLSGVLLRGEKVAHSSLYHPACACGAGALNAMRWISSHDSHEYKAMWSTGGVDGCNSRKTSCTEHNPPLLFDLTVDQVSTASKM
jgi:hypothetical protein